MGFWGIIGLGIALAMDAGAVSMVNGMVDRRIDFWKAVWIAVVFGTFQLAMAILGFVSETLFQGIIEQFDHWIALVLLSAIGGKMVFEAFKPNTSAHSCDITNRKLYAQGIATSIDAYAAGIGLAILDASLVLFAPVVFLTTFLICIGSVYLGKRFGVLFRRHVEWMGGLILIGIGISMFLGHINI